MLNTPVVIGTHEGSPWLDDLRRSIPTDREVLMHGDGGYEPPALRAGLARFDRFLYLQDSTLILDRGFWDLIDETLEGFLFPKPGCYLGVYTEETITPVLAKIPDVVDKQTSIDWESRLHLELPEYRVLFPRVADRSALGIEHRHGRDNLVIGNDMIRKFKGTARCVRCVRLRDPGLCPHYQQRFAARLAA